jgi:hypothetical protein
VGYSTGILTVQSNSRKSAQRFSAPELRENKSNSRKSAQRFSAPELRQNKSNSRKSAQRFSAPELRRNKRLAVDFIRNEKSP